MYKHPKIGDLSHLTQHQVELGLKVVSEMANYQSGPITADSLPPPEMGEPRLPLPPALWGLTPEDWNSLIAALYSLQMQRMHSTLH
jgi:hypothetical protein